jgi:hypothetical protein
MIPLLAAALLLAGCGVAERPESRVETLAAVENAPFVNAHAIIILRHAAIDTALKATLGNQVPLTTRGQDRAKEVVTALHDAGITRIVTSTALRTQQTAAPLAAELHIKPETPVGHGAEGPAATMAGPPAGTGRALPSPAMAEAGTVYGFLAESARPTDTILLVHHHSVIPSIMAEFGFTHEPAIDDATEFDRVYVILPDPEHHTYRVLRLRYGGNWSAK